MRTSAKQHRTRTHLEKRDKLIKISDFARAQGVTPRAVQKLFKKYKTDLEGHFEEKGQNGTWLDEQAQEFLRSKMKQNPITIYDEKALPFYEELKREQAENRELREKLSEVLEKLSEAKDYQLHLQGELMEQRLLAAKATEAEQRASEAEQKAAESEKQAISARQKEIEAELALTAIEEENKTLSDVAEMNAQEAERAKAEAEALQAEIERLKKRNLWQRIFNKE